MFKKKLLCLFITAVFSLPFYGFAQSGNINIELSSVVSTKENQAFWLTSNKYGKYDKLSSQGLIAISGNTAIYNSGFVKIESGAELLLREGEETRIFFNEGYANISASIFQLKIGRFKETVGGSISDLSSGSMIESGNTTPIPKIKMGLLDFEELPYTNGHLLIKGFISHGWFENNRMVANAYLHEKALYVSSRRDGRVYGTIGLIHVAQWAGTSSDSALGKQPDSFKDFLKVVFGKEGGKNSLESEQANVLGNQLGIWDFLAGLNLNTMNVKLSWQHYFDDKSGSRFYNGFDGLWGVNLELKKKEAPIQQILWEFIYTKNQSGSGRGDPNSGNPGKGRDNYYNNYIYQSGWSYYGNTLGTPLFIPKNLFTEYFPNAQIGSGEGFIVSNRMVGHHIALKGFIQKDVNYKLLVTYNRHYGTYSGIEQFGSAGSESNIKDYTFYPPLHQWYMMYELKKDLSWKNLQEITFAVEYDTGDLINNFGIMAGLSWGFGY